MCTLCKEDAQLSHLVSGRHTHKLKGLNVLPRGYPTGGEDAVMKAAGDNGGAGVGGTGNGGAGFGGLQGDELGQGVGVLQIHVANLEHKVQV